MRRIHLSIIVGLCAALLALVSLSAAHRPGDVAWAINGARALLADQSPYQVETSPLNGNNDPLYYPLPAVLAVLPLARLPLLASSVLFAGVSAALLAWALPRGQWWALASAPAYVSLWVAQWPPLLVAAALLPPLAPLLAVKPTLGAALWLYRPSRWGLIGGALLCLVGLFWLPSWPAEWLATLRAAAHHPIPVLMLPFGPLLLLATLRWRDPRARLLLALACMPQEYWHYDQLPLFLVVPSGWPCAVLAILSWLRYAIWAPCYTAPWWEGQGEVIIAIVTMYLPALILLWRADDEPV